MCACVILISASLAGPMAGGPFPPSSGGSPAVIPEFFDRVCPNPTVIDRDTISGALGDASAATIFQAWLDGLERIEDRCVEIKANTPQIFDFWYALALLFLVCLAGSFTCVGKGYSETRKDCLTYGHHYPLHQFSLTFPGPHLSPTLFP